MKMNELRRWKLGRWIHGSSLSMQGYIKENQQQRESTAINKRQAGNREQNDRDLSRLYKIIQKDVF